MRHLLRGSKSRIVAGLFLALFLFHFASLLSYPPPNCDETFYGRSAIRFASALAGDETWPPAGSLFFVPHGRSYWLLLASAFWLFGETLFAARLVSLTGLAALAAATYMLGRAYATRSVAAWSAGLVGVAWLSLFAGHFARPDIWAAAAGTATLGLLEIARRKRQPWMYAGLGLALALQLDLHLNLLHFVLPVLAIGAWYTLRERHFAHFGLLAGGLLLGGVAVAYVHLGGAVGEIAATVARDPGALLNSYLNQDAGRSQAPLVAAAVSLARFWWRYYAWLTPYLSLPQAALFLFGLIGALAYRGSRRRSLALIIVASSFTFAVVNRNYQWLGYSILWLPLYMVLGVAELDRLLRRVQRPRAAGRLLTATLSGLALLYVGGDLHLASSHYGQGYFKDAHALLARIPTGSRVLTSAMWWYGMKDDVVFLDEYLAAPVDSNVWWQGVPDHTSADHSNLVTAPPESAADEIDAQMSMVLRPDFVIADSVIGCLSTPDENSAMLEAYIDQSCQLVDVYDSETYGVQRIYACTAANLEVTPTES